MLKLKNAVFSFLIESVVKKFNEDEEVNFDHKVISQECSRQIMQYLQNGRHNSEDKIYKDEKEHFYFVVDPNYVGLSDSYLYKKGKEIRLRKVDLPIRSEEKYVELFTKYLGYNTISNFLDFAEANIISRQKVNIKVPESLIVPIQQYLLFFREYTKNTKDIEIRINTIETDSGVEIIFDVPPPMTIDEVNSWFSEYMTLLKDNFDNDDASYTFTDLFKKQNLTLTSQQELFVMRLQNEINHLKMSLKMAKFENELLEEKYQDVKKIALELSNKETVIHNQYIQSGNQQFANNIGNNNP